MRYEWMYPHQIRSALRRNLPVAMAAGVLEYHADHCVVGVDTVLVQRALKMVESERERDLVLLPPFFYGAASYAVEPPERNGTLHIGAPAIQAFARDLFRSLLRVGFRNVHVFVHHQSENFLAGMPTDLALRLAAREVIFEHLEREHGEGWWGSAHMQNYYQQHASGADPFSWINVHPFLDEETQKLYPIDHASKQETSLMLAFCPEGVDMKRRTSKKWYARGAQQASREYGLAAQKRILERLRDVLK